MSPLNFHFHRPSLSISLVPHLLCSSAQVRQTWQCHRHSDKRNREVSLLNFERRVLENCGLGGSLLNSEDTKTTKVIRYHDCLRKQQTTTNLFFLCNYCRADNMMSRVMLFSLTALLELVRSSPFLLCRCLNRAR